MDTPQNRRTFIRKSGLIAIGTLAASQLSANDFGLLNVDAAIFTLPPLPYDYNALEPYIDTLTMQIHHDKHHKVYVDKLNEAIAASKITETSLEKMFQKINSYPVAIRNHGGGHYNHSMFWQIMTPGGGNASGVINEAIIATFGSMDEFKKKFNDAAKSRFGSGWAWLIKNNSGKLEICSTANQDNPLMEVAEIKGTPLLGLDVWEHAYYLKYQNLRADYIAAFWNVVNWNEVNKRFAGK